MVFAHGVAAGTKPEKVEDIVKNVVKNIAANVPEDHLDIYEKFSRKAANFLYLENSTSDDEVTFLTNALVLTCLSINYKNKDEENKDVAISKVTNDLDIEKEKILKQTLKENYQLWLNNNTFLKRNAGLLNNRLIQIFENNSVVILDSNLSKTIHETLINLNESTNQSKIEEAAKKHVLEFLRDTTDKEIKRIEKTYASTLKFGVEISAYEEKDLYNIADSVTKEILAHIGVILIIGDMAEIETIIKECFQIAFDNGSFPKSSQNVQKICLQIYFRRFQKFFVDKPNFNLLHYGKNIDLEEIKKDITGKIEFREPKIMQRDHEKIKKAIAGGADSNTIKLLLDGDSKTSEKSLESIRKVRESWGYFEQFLNSWIVAILGKTKFELSEESTFVSKYVDAWFRELQPYIEGKDSPSLEPCDDFKTLSDCLDEIFLSDKDFFLFFVQDEMDSSNRNIKYAALNKEISRFEKEYLYRPEVQKKYDLFRERIKQWSQKNYVAKLSFQEKDDLSLRKQHRILMSFLLKDIKENNNLDYRSARYIEIVRASYASEKKINEFNLISGAVIDEAKLSGLKLTKLDLAQLNYFKIAKEKNPIFKYFDFQNNDRQMIWNQYREYRKSSIQESEKQAHDLVVKILLEGSEDQGAK